MNQKIFVEYAKKIDHPIACMVGVVVGVVVLSAKCIYIYKLFQNLFR